MIAKRGIILLERMSGWLAFDDTPDQAKPFSINLRAFASDPLKLFGNREMQGQSEIVGHTDRFATQGSLQILPGNGNSLLPSGVAYNFTFDHPDEGELRFVGQKTYAYPWKNGAWKAFFKSLKTLPLDIYRNDEKVGRAELFYGASILYFILFGFRLCRADSAFRPHRQAANKFVPLAKLFVPGYQKTLSDDELAGEIEAQLGTTPRHVRFLMTLTRGLVAWMIRVRYFSALEKLKPLQKERLEQLFTYNNLAYILTTTLRAPMIYAAYGTRAWAEANDFHVPVPPQTVEEPRWKNLHMTPNRALDVEDVEVDVLVVGSGAGGAAAAYQLSKQGLAVAIVEEGSYFSRQDFTGLRTEMEPKLYHQGGYQFAYGNSIPVWLPTGRCVGGTTLINSGTCARPKKELFDKWRWDLGVDVDLEPYFPEVEQVLNATPVKESLLGGVEEVIRKGCEGKDLNHGPLTRAESGCDGQGFCIEGCPTNAKRSTAVSFIPEALKQNAFLFSNYRVKKLHFEGKKVAAVDAHVPGYGHQFRLRFRPKRVVLACGTLATPRVLRANGLHRGLKQLGKNLTMHPAPNLNALIPQKARNKMLVPQSYGVFDIPGNHYILEGYTLLPEVVGFSTRLIGQQLDTLMEQFWQVVSFAMMQKDVTSGGLKFIGKHWAIPYYFFTQEAVDGLRDGSALLTEIFMDGGATEVYTQFAGFEVIKTRQQLEAFRKHAFKAREIAITAYHPLGTCRMGSSAHNGVVSQDGLVWGTDNLYIADGSAIPGPLGINPQVTIMANALRIAEQIGEGMQ